MKLKEYIEALTDIEKDHPDAKLVYACDEEGNRFSEVFYQPAAGCYNGCDWLTEGDLEHEDGEVNAVLLN
jgi:hypothetical protein|tara:strand:+ start:111 stop:320 length:210 start_codon:yes stop_codon:yes gene_type:complete